MRIGVVIHQRKQGTLSAPLPPPLERYDQGQGEEADEVYDEYTVVQTGTRWECSTM